MIIPISLSIFVFFIFLEVKYLKIVILNVEMELLK